MFNHNQVILLIISIVIFIINIVSTHLCESLMFNHNQVILLIISIVIFIINIVSTHLCESLMFNHHHVILLIINIVSTHLCELLMFNHNQVILLIISIVIFIINIVGTHLCEPLMFNHSHVILLIISIVGTHLCESLMFNHSHVILLIINIVGTHLCESLMFNHSHVILLIINIVSTHLCESLTSNHNQVILLITSIALLIPSITTSAPLTCVNSQVHVEVALVLGGVGAMRALEVHVPHLPLGPLAALALVRVLDVVLQVLLAAKRSLTVVALEVVLVHVGDHFALEGQELGAHGVVHEAGRREREEVGHAAGEPAVAHLGRGEVVRGVGRLTDVGGHGEGRVEAPGQGGRHVRGKGGLGEDGDAGLLLARRPVVVEVEGGHLGLFPRVLRGLLRVLRVLPGRVEEVDGRVAAAWPVCFLLHVLTLFVALQERLLDGRLRAGLSVQDLAGNLQRRPVHLVVRHVTAVHDQVHSRLRLFLGLLRVVSVVGLGGDDPAHDVLQGLFPAVTSVA